MDIPKKYKALVNRIRNEVRRDGKLVTREDIAFELGLTRSHFDKLISPGGNPTEDDLKDLFLHFPELLESVESDSNAALVANCKLLKNELDLTKELLKEKNVMIRALEAEVKSLKRQVEVLEKLAEGQPIDDTDREIPGQMGQF